MDMEDWQNAKNDWDKALATDDFKTDAEAYLHRMAVNYRLGNFSLVCKDIYTAYNLTNDKKMETELQNLWKKCGCR